MTRLTREEVTQFAYGEADELEETVLADDQYLGWVEAIWARELPTDLRPGVLRAIQLQGMVIDGFNALVDLTGAFGAAAVRYLEASIDDGTCRSDG